LFDERVVAARASCGRALAAKLVRLLIDAVQPCAPVLYCERGGFPIQKRILAAGAMSGRTRPSIVGSLAHHSGPPRVLLDVTDRVGEMRFVQHAGERALLPQLSDETVLAIESLGMGTVESMKDAMDRIEAVRYGDIVDVVRYQAVRHNPKKVIAAAVAREFQIVETVGFVSENIKAPGAALRDVQRQSGHDKACGSGHGFNSDCTARKILGAERKGRAMMAA
jgi:hypothetical protein